MLETTAPAAILPTIVNRTSDGDNTVTVLLGFSKYLCRGFERNNIQMTGNWYLDNVESQASDVSAYIAHHKPKFVNFVGTSKSCTGAFIFANRLAPCFPKTIFRVFAFSAYTRLDRTYYEQTGRIGDLPESLVRTWETAEGLALTERYKDAINLVQASNIKVYLIFPSRSRGTEPDAAKRMSHLENVALVPLRVRVHSVIFPFWRTLTPNAKIETFEGLRPTKLKPDVYNYFHAMQTDPWYRFSLYTLIFETPRFREEMKRFNASFSDQANAKGA